MKKAFLLALVISGCADAPDEVLTRLEEKRAIVFVTERVAFEHLSKPADLSRGYELSKLKEKRFDEGLPYDDLDAEINTITERLKADEKESERLQNAFADAVIDLYAYFSAISVTCGAFSKEIPALVTRMKLDKLKAPDTESVESQFWTSKWGYDEEMKTANLSIDCDVVRPQIEQALVLVNRKFDALESPPP